MCVCGVRPDHRREEVSSTACFIRKLLGPNPLLGRPSDLVSPEDGPPEEGPSALASEPYGGPGSPLRPDFGREHDGAEGPIASESIHIIGAQDKFAPRSRALAMVPTPACSKPPSSSLHFSLSCRYDPSSHCTRTVAKLAVCKQPFRYGCSVRKSYTGLGSGV